MFFNKNMPRKRDEKRVEHKTLWILWLVVVADLKKKKEREMKGKGNKTIITVCLQ
jgi:hypothetical protein